MKAYDMDPNEDHDWEEPEPVFFPDDEIYDATDLPRLRPVRAALGMALSTYGPLLTRSE